MTATHEVKERLRQRIRLRSAQGAEDMRLVSELLRADSRAAALTSDVREVTTPAAMEAAVSAGLGLRLVESSEGEAVGLVTWRTRGNPRSYELAVLIGDPALWSSGIGGDATLQAVDFLFMTMGAERVGVVTGAFNPYTSPALERGGFTLEGILRRFYFMDGEFHDGLMWSMLREDHQRLIEVAKGTPLAYIPLIAQEDRERAALMMTHLMSRQRSEESKGETQNSEARA